MSHCGTCGARLSPGDRFCGACGAAVSSPAPASPIGSVGRPDGRSETLVGWVLLGAGLALAAASVGAYLWLRDVTPSEEASAGAPAGAPVGGAPADAPAAVDLRPLPAAATEIDRPGDFAYASTSTSCAAETQVTDELKKLGLAVDEHLRSGTHLTSEEEEALGAKALTVLEAQLGGRLLRSGAQVDYLTAVGRSLWDRGMRREVRPTFYLWTETEVINAIALPGGHVVVSQALWDAWLRNEAQLATVIGHELGHVELRHPLAVFELLRASGLPEDEAIVQLLIALARIPYTATQEEASDAWGAEAMHGAGYSVFQSVSMWEFVTSLRADERPAHARPGPDDPLGQLAEAALGELHNLTVTHPAPRRRACLLKQRARALYAEWPRDAAYVGATNLARRVPMSTRVY